MGDGNFRPPTESTPLDRSSKKLLLVITSSTPTAVPNLVQIRPRGLLGKWVKYNENFFYLFIYLFIYKFFSWPHLQVRPADGFSRLMAQTTRICARMCLLGVSLTLLPILGVKYPKKPNFWGVNRRFQAKQAKYWKFHVIETTASISTKFCATIETIKWSSWVVSIGAQQNQDGGQPPLWKKPVKSLYLCNGLTNLYKIWYADAKCVP